MGALVQSIGGRKAFGAATAGLAVVTVILAALPSMASGASSETPVVSAYAIPGGAGGSILSIAPAAGGAADEWLIDSPPSSNPMLLTESVSGGTPTAVSGANIGGATFGGTFGNGAGTLVNDGSVDYAINSTPQLYSINSAGLGTATNIDISATGTDMVIGPDGALYTTSDGSGQVGRCAVTSTPVTCSAFTISPPIPQGAGGPDAITSADGRLWFTTQDDVLGSVNTSGSSVGGPYEENPSDPSGTGEVDWAPGTLTTLGGDLWDAGNPSDTGTFDEIYKINPAEPSAAATVYGAAAGIPAGANITSLTAGPDGNLWFADSASDKVGMLDVSTGAVTEYSLPTGYSVAGQIAPGPANSGTVWFSATRDDAPAIGEVSGLTTSKVVTPPPTSKIGTLKIGGKAPVSSKGVAAVALLCSGASGATCSGKLALTATEKLKHKKKKTVKLGSASYNVTAGKRKTLSIKLSGAGKAALKAAEDKLKATARATASDGKTSIATVMLTETKPKKKHKK